MTMLFEINAYCSECSRDVASTEAETLEEATELIEHQAEQKFQAHKLDGTCT